MLPPAIPTIATAVLHSTLFQECIIEGEKDITYPFLDKVSVRFY